PKVDLETGALRGVEALARWPHEERGSVPPTHFVPIAEHTGLIRPLTLLVVELAVHQLREWADMGIELPIAVNLSPYNLHDPQLIAEIRALIGQGGIEPSRLQFEITETALAE